jgi:hypothetical protein
MGPQETHAQGEPAQGGGRARLQVETGPGTDDRGHRVADGADPEHHPCELPAAMTASAAVASASAGR